MTSGFGAADMNVVPRVYGAGELGVLSITAPGEQHPRVTYVGGEVFVGLVSSDTGAAITQGEAEGWSHPFQDVLDSAVASAGPLPAPVDGVLHVEDETLAAAVLHSPARMAAQSFHGAPVLFALARDRMVVVGSDDEPAFAQVLDLADKLFEVGGALVSAHPIMLTADGWAPFRWLERFPELEMRIQRVLRLFSVRAYEAQSVALKRPDVHLADPKIQMLETGVTTTFAAWPKGTATLLPVVDNVIIADSAADATQLSVTTMKEFLDAAGDAVIRTGLSPLRYFVPGEAPNATAE